MSTEKDSFEESTIQLLMSLGLTCNQARCYVALVKLRSATANSISKISGVGREEVYRILPRLIQLGLIKEIIGRPKRFEPFKLKDAFNILITRKKEELATIEKKASSINNLEIKRERIAIEEPTFTFIPKEKACLQTAKGTWNKVEEEICFYFTAKQFLSYLSFFKKDIELALKRDIRIYLITEKNEAIRKVEQTLKRNFWIRYVTHPVRPVFLIRDKKVVGINTSTSQEADFADYPALISSSPALVSLCLNVFEREWDEAVEYANCEQISIY